MTQERETSSFRVGVYGTGQYGLEAVRLLHALSIPVVAAWNRASSKTGRDLGELAGIGTSGVIVEDCETASFEGRDLDVVLHVTTDRLAQNMPAYRRLLGAGINVICHGGEAYYPQASSPVLAEEIDSMALASGVTFTGTGIWDASRLWSGLLAAGTTSRFAELTHRTVTDAQSAGLALMRVCGVGLSLQEFANANMAAIGGMYKTVLMHVLHALGLTVEAVEEQIEPVTASSPVWCRLLEQDLAPGTALGTRIISRVSTREGPTAVSVNELRILEEGESEHMVWEVDGPPHGSVRVNRSAPVCSSATNMVNRIPDVIAAPPGIRLVSQLGPMRPLFLHEAVRGLRA